MCLFQLLFNDVLRISGFDGNLCVCVWRVNVSARERERERKEEVDPSSTNNQSRGVCLQLIVCVCGVWGVDTSVMVKCLAAILKKYLSPFLRFCQDIKTTVSSEAKSLNRVRLHELL